MAFVPITEPRNEKPRPKAAIFHITFPFFMKFAKAAEVPKIAANLLVPRAAWGGIPAISSEGSRMRPPPPAMLSMKPAINDIRQRNKTINGSS